MKLVVDTNILFSFFWKKYSVRNLVLDQELVLFAPEFALKEIKKYKKEIIKKAKISEKEFNLFRNDLAIAIEFIPEEKYKRDLKKALLISPDEKDIDFFALALFLKLPLWSNDRILKKQNSLEVLNTRDVFERKIFLDFELK